MSAGELIRMLRIALDSGADTVCLTRDQAWDALAYLWAAKWAELLGWDCKRREKR